MAPINYTQVVIAWVADVCLFDADVMWTDILGTVLILTFTFFNTLNKSGAFGGCKSKQEQTGDIELY